MNHFSTWRGRGLLAAGCGLLVLSSLLFLTSVFSERTHAEKSELQVINTFPANGAQDVFLTSGIEITFNTDTVSAAGLERSLQISPEIEVYVISGADDHTLVIYPSDEYEPETQYQVTIKAGLTSTDGRTLKEDVVFSFNTASEDLEEYYQGTIIAPAGQGRVMNALTTEIPAAFLLMDQDLLSNFEDGVPEAEITLFRFDTAADFTGALIQGLTDREEYYREKDRDPSRGKGIHEEARFTVKAEEVTDNNYWWWRYQEYVLSFPEKLPEGQYLAQVDFQIKTKHQDMVVTKYILIQSTELSSFVMSSGQNSVAWIHNGTTGSAVSEASVALYGASSYMDALTLDDGSAQLNMESSIKEAAKEGKIDKKLAEQIPYSYRILDVKDGEHRFIEAISSEVLYNGYFGFGSSVASEKYYTYIYTDRRIYSITDEIQFFGVALPRTADTAAPEKLKVSVGAGWWNTGDIASVEVMPDEKGYFSGTLSFEDQQAVSYACLSVEDSLGNTLMTSDSFSIEDYVKPTYTYEVSADKPVYVLGADGDEEAVISFDISYFDQTPAADFGLESEWSSRGLESTGDALKADEKGHIEDHVTLHAEQFDNSWYPQDGVVSYESADI